NKNNPTTDTEAKTAVESFVSQANHASEPITYMILTYKNPDGISKMHHQYRVNNGATGNPVNREIFIQNTGDKYYSVIVDVSGKTLLFRNYIDRSYTSHVTIQPFAGVDGEDTKQYDLYLREAAFVTSLEDAKAYCEGLISAGDSSLYHMNGEGVPETEIRITLDKHAYRMNAGDKLTIGVETDEEATITYESSNTNVATVENGVITAVTNGETEITVTATKGELVGTDKIKIYVIDEISPITVDKKADAPIAPAVMPKITFLGDSITAGSQTSKTYHSYLADRLYVTAVNNGLSGSNIAGVGSSNQASFIDRVSQIPDDTDLIFVMGGTNDFGQNAGTLERFVPGIRTLIESLITRFPDKPIVFSTPLQNGGYFSITTNKAGETLAQYVAEIEEACAEYGIPVIKTYRNAAFKDFCIWDGDTVTGYNETYYADGVHPNAAGHEVMADFFEEELEKAGVVKYVKYETEPEIMYGDVDGNGIVEPADAVALARFNAKWTGYSEDDINLNNSDVDGKGGVDATDGVILSRYFAEWAGYETLPFASDAKADSNE
ncbi:MAG: Ig-like domain-containing protein, partial [Clostridia bacterium]|nr:Ig-like domain-containing protein [Clostridia bacterium]